MFGAVNKIISPSTERGLNKIKIVGSKLFSYDLYLQGKELSAWQNKVQEFADCLRTYRLVLSLTTGEANERLYRPELSNYIKKTIVPEVGFKPFEEPPPIWAVAGPLIEVDPGSHTSWLIELQRAGILKLFCSDNRQSEHFRIGGWNPSFDTGNSAERVYVEDPHPPLLPSNKRRHRIFKKKELPKKVDEYVIKFSNIASQLRDKEIRSRNDYDRFIFLERKNIRSIVDEFHDGHGREAFSKEREELINRENITDIMRRLKIERLAYPN